MKDSDIVGMIVSPRPMWYCWIGSRVQNPLVVMVSPLECPSVAIVVAPMSMDQTPDMNTNNGKRIKMIQLSFFKFYHLDWN